MKPIALLVLSCIVGAPVSASGQSGATVSGMVVDASNAPVAGATVIAEAGGRRLEETETRLDGRFALTVPPGEVVVTARAPGFASTSLMVRAGANEPLVRIVLHPAPFVESVTVTASRGAEKLATAASTSVVTSGELLNSAAGAIDDALRHTPGFSLFRRSSSRVANPTTQGVTLRGVSGSGASRTLVLADGLPLNDPFGSWVYWNRIPQAAIDRIEVVRGAAGDLYGADALGGVIQILTLDPTRPRARAQLEAGSHDTGRASLFTAGQYRRWFASAAGEWLDTGGVPVVAEAERGRVDVRADSDYRTGFAAFGYVRGPWRASVRASAYTEDRGNGTPLQVNSTAWRQAGGEATGTAGGGVWEARGAGGTQDYYQTFTAIAADRASERMTSFANTATSFATYGGQWTRPVGGHVLLIGAEGKRTESTIENVAFTVAGVQLAPTYAGGTETVGSIYGRARLAAASRLTVVAGARVDFWNSQPRSSSLPSHDVTFFSPRASAAWRAGEGVSVNASVYRAYRTPTLNELYRAFRVGNVLTNPNPLLQPERLTGVEGGVLVARGRASARVTGFWNVLDDAVSNVTISTTPSLITRQRQNTDKVRAAGIEVEADLRPAPALTITAVLALTRSRYVDAPQQPALEGNRIPQVPSYHLGGGVTYTNPRLATLTLQLRAVGLQFDDDLNTFELEPFGVVDVSASRPIARQFHGFVAIENLFDKEYDVGRTPVRTVGWPRTVRAGLRVFLP